MGFRDKDHNPDLELRDTKCGKHLKTFENQEYANADISLSFFAVEYLTLMSSMACHNGLIDWAVRSSLAGTT